MSDKCDVLISGAGPVGLTFACLLKSQQPSLSVYIVDPQLDTSIAKNFSADQRTIAMSLATQEVYEGLGCWKALVNTIGKIERIFISDAGHAGKAVLDKADNNGRDLGYVVDQFILKQTLLKRAKQLDVKVLACAVAGVQPHPTGVWVETGDHQKVDAALLVVAEGANSPTRERLGITVKTTDYRQHALVTRVQHEYAHKQEAYERFTAGGPIALLPLRHKRESALVLCSNLNTKPETASRSEINTFTSLDTMPEQHFLRVLHENLGYPHGAFTGCSERLVFPLTLVQANEQVRRSVVLIGNAYRSLHPVAGQGYNLSIRQCVELTAALCSQGNYYRFHNEPIGSIARLEAFVESIDSDQRQTVTFSHGLHQVFANDFLPLALARTLGLSSFAGSGALKAPLFSQLMGRSRPRRALSIFHRAANKRSQY